MSSQKNMGKGFEGASRHFIGDLSINLIVGARLRLGCKVGSKDVECLAMEHGSSAFIPVVSKKMVNKCMDDTCKWNFSSSFPLSIDNFVGGIEGLGPTPSIQIKRPRGQPPKTTRYPLCSNFPPINISKDIDPCDLVGLGSMEGSRSFSSNVQSIGG